MKKIIQFLLIFLIIIFLLISWYFIKLLPVSHNFSKINFIINKGTSVKKITKDLESKKLIKSALAANIYIYLNNLEKNIQAGEYLLSADQGTKNIISILVQGQIINQEKTVKIIEGLTMKEIAQELEKNGFGPVDFFLTVSGFPKVDYREAKNYPEPYDFSKDFSLLIDKPKYVGLEGYLFPDTYRFYNNSTPKDIIFKMLNNLDSKITSEMRQEIKNQGKTFYEVITMASLLEKEVRNLEDMKIVSGIFWKRIKNKQRLESCATLSYILGINKTQYSLEDTEIKSPYNTYQNFGLPLGPISNPGLNAILAAIYPKYTDYNFFLTDPKTGKTVFSKTFNEHIINKEKYLK